MTPRTSTVLRVRWCLRVGLRLGAAVLAVVFAWRVAWAVGVYSNSLENFLRFGVLHGITPLGGLIVLVLVDVFAMRLLVPAGRWVCPRCGYDLENVNRPKCPECGQRLSDEVVGQPAAEDAA